LAKTALGDDQGRLVDADGKKCLRLRVSRRTLNARWNDSGGARSNAFAESGPQSALFKVRH
jgi:hypothetical protein